jgi:signal transduction histidine kinase
MYSSTGSITPLPIRAAAADLSGGLRLAGNIPLSTGSWPCPRRRPQPQAAGMRGEDLLHDARNLMSALGLYCDLLAMPGVLQPRHRKYAEDLRLVGTRSEALIGRLMEQLARSAAEVPAPEGTGPESPALNLGAATAPVDSCSPAWLRVLLPAQAPCRDAGVAPASLRGTVERCLGLLTQVAAGRAIEVSFGEAAVAPVRIGEEELERILVNLVRNSAAALERAEAPAGAAGAIRIEVGMLTGGVGDPQAWPFRRVRLTVDDAGCGMAPEQIQRLLGASGVRSRGTHGIGFRIVRELVAASSGELRVRSAPGMGTRVQIEWPLAAMSLPDSARSLRRASAPAAGRRVSC